jgi:hypothetical protein
MKCFGPAHWHKRRRQFGRTPTAVAYYLAQRLGQGEVGGDLLKVRSHDCPIDRLKCCR